MAIRKIVTREDPVLRKISRPVEKIDERMIMLMNDMYDTMKDVGVGLAAVQVGVLRRAIVIDIGDGRIDLINPVIISQEGMQEVPEGCLSCPGAEGTVRRPMKVTVKALDIDGNERTLTGEGLLARAFCHEIDHLDGILFTDKADNITTYDD